jgi:hypothetical protein
MSDNSRARLHALLGEACELEHALCCSYLYAAFSLRRDVSEGLDWQSQQMARQWASRVYHIAAQEMLHLAQAWNILTATGGSAYYDRPVFPQPARVFPLKVALSLRRFDLSTLDRFLVYESPGEAAIALEGMALAELWPIDEHHPYSHVGELYREIARIIAASEEMHLFVGARDRQRDRRHVDFYDIITVTDRKSALAAIDRITLQGEGSSSEQGGTAAQREDSHFGVFSAMRAQLVASRADLGLPVADNPYLRSGIRQQFINKSAAFADAGIVTTPITDDYARYAIDLFNDVYVAMLQALAHLFEAEGRNSRHLERVSRAAIELMITVIKPLGEAICRLPSGKEGINAGPSFEIARHLRLPPDQTVAAEVLADRLRQLASHGTLLRHAPGDHAAQPQVVGATLNLVRIATTLEGK